MKHIKVTTKDLKTRKIKVVYFNKSVTSPTQSDVGKRLGNWTEIVKVEEVEF